MSSSHCGFTVVYIYCSLYLTDSGKLSSLHFIGVKIFSCLVEFTRFKNSFSTCSLHFLSAFIRNFCGSFQTH